MPCSSCTTGAPRLRSVRLRMMASGSRLETRRRVCRTRSPYNWASAMIASGGSVSSRPCSSGATVSARRNGSRATNSDQFSQTVGRNPWLRKVSNKTSRRPADSAANNTRPGNCARKSSSAAAGFSARGCKGNTGGGAVGKLMPPSWASCNSTRR